MIINKKMAASILEEQIVQAVDNNWSREWELDVERLSDLCERGYSKTHIAFLGTSLLAKSIANNIDLYAIKPNHDKDNKLAYSARSLAHGVLVPLAAKHGVHLGVTGREPLNNQPYFRMTRLDDGTPVHQGGQEAFDFMLKLIEKAVQLSSYDEARAALRAFIAVRKRYQPTYLDLSKRKQLSIVEFVDLVDKFVDEESEGGKRAQAVVAGVLDSFLDPSVIETGRINDPSRKHPGDVCITDC